MYGRRVVFATVMLLSAGCAARRNTYCLLRTTSGVTLVPPGVARADAGSGRITEVGSGKPCPDGGPALRATARGKRLRIDILRDALMTMPQGWLWTWTGEAEQSGCIAPGSGLRLMSWIVESVPMDPRAAQRLTRLAGRASWVEIGPESRLQVVTPIMRAGASPDAVALETKSVTGSGNALNVDVKAADSLLGFETAWYGVVPKQGPGFELAALSAERTIDGKTESAATPLASYLRFPPESNFYRLYFKADLDGSAVTQMVITAPTRAELDRRTKEIDADSSRCAAPDGLCVAVPRRAAINVWMAVSVNGREVRVRGGAVRGAIEASGEKDFARVLRTLKVHRPYRDRLSLVEFDRAGTEILELPLMGGERITW